MNADNPPIAVDDDVIVTKSADQLLSELRELNNSNSSSEEDQWLEQMLAKVHACSTSGREGTNQCVISSNRFGIEEWTRDDIEQYLTERRAVQSSSSSNNGISRDQALVELIAVTCRACVLTQVFYPRDTQILSLLLLFRRAKEQLRGCLLQIATGEGKSITVAMFAAVKALLDNVKVDVVTSSAVLARRDAENFVHFFSVFGLSVDNNCTRRVLGDRIKCYGADILYGDMRSFKADILRCEFHAMKGRRGNPVRPFASVIVDEVDSMLLDEVMKGELLQLSFAIPGMEYLESLLWLFWGLFLRQEPTLHPNDSSKVCFKVGDEWFEASHSDFENRLKELFKELLTMEENPPKITMVAEKINVDADGNCLFRSFAVSLHGRDDDLEHRKLRKAAVEILATFEDDPKRSQEDKDTLKNMVIANLPEGQKDMTEYGDSIAKYASDYMAQDTMWGGTAECQALAIKLNRHVAVINSRGNSVTVYHPDFTRTEHKGITQEKYNEIWKLENDPLVIWHDGSSHFKSVRLVNSVLSRSMSQKLTQQFSSALDCFSTDNDLIRVPPHLRNFSLKQLPTWIQSMKQALEKREWRQYCIQESKIVPIDYQNTGIWLRNNTMDDGLHQFLQIKHELCMDAESLVTSLITNFDFTKRYKEVYGLSGTLGNSREQAFLKNTYNTDIVLVPTFATSQLQQLEPIYADDTEKWIDSIKETIFDVVVQQQRGALIICESIEMVSEISVARDIPGINVYKYTDEFDTFPKLIKPMDVIYTTNIGGRGIDYVVCPEVEQHGGMHVILAFMPKNDRVQRQAFGRTARKGQRVLSGGEVY